MEPDLPDDGVPRVQQLHGVLGVRPMRQGGGSELPDRDGRGTHRRGRCLPVGVITSSRAGRTSRVRPRRSERRGPSSDPGSHVRSRFADSAPGTSLDTRAPGWLPLAKVRLRAPARTTGGSLGDLNGAAVLPPEHTGFHGVSSNSRPRARTPIAGSRRRSSRTPPYAGRSRRPKG